MSRTPWTADDSGHCRQISEIARAMTYGMPAQASPAAAAADTWMLVGATRIPHNATNPPRRANKIATHQQAVTKVVLLRLPIGGNWPLTGSGCRRMEEPFCTGGGELPSPGMLLPARNPSFCRLMVCRLMGKDRAALAASYSLSLSRAGTSCPSVARYWSVKQVRRQSASTTRSSKTQDGAGFSIVSNGSRLSGPVSEAGQALGCTLHRRRRCVHALPQSPRTVRPVRASWPICGWELSREK